MSEDFEDIALPDMRYVKVNRSELATFLPTPRLIKAFEDLTKNVQEVIPIAINEGAQVAENALLGASTALGRGESARGAVDMVIPAVQALQAQAGAERMLSSEVARLARRLEQVEALIQQSGQQSTMQRLTRRVEQVEVLAQALNRANSEIQRLQSRIANLETLVLGA